MQTLEDDDDYYLWDEGGRPCIPAPGSRLDEAVQDVLCVPEWQEEGIPTKSKQGKFLDSKPAFKKGSRFALCKMFVSMITPQLNTMSMTDGSYKVTVGGIRAVGHSQMLVHD